MTKATPTDAVFLADPAIWDQPQERSGADMQIVDGTRIAVIGGGPAGSMFSFFLLRLLRMSAHDVQVTIYEPRDFDVGGPAGCNHCGGIVSESLVQLLAAEGIHLPEDVVQRGIEAYDLHMDIGSVSIRTPLEEKRIAAVYRGNGPRNSSLLDQKGFDRYLLDNAREQGADVRRKLVSSVAWREGRPVLTASDGTEEEYDLLVVASGVNSLVMHLIEDLNLGYRSPETVKTFISEYHLGEDQVRRRFGNAMNVFLLDIPRLKFAAAIPKGAYVTVVMLGRNIDDELVRSFMNADEVRARFDDGVVPANVCHCFPRINLSPARQPFADRLVFVGDAGVSRLYKDGIGAAYRTAKAAARTVAAHGFSGADFAKHYAPVCRRLSFDNNVGKFIFTVSNLIQTNRFARRGVLRMTALEQASRTRPRRMSGVLWDLFTGSAPYYDVFLRTLHPMFLFQVVWNLVAGNLLQKRTQPGMS